MHKKDATPAFDMWSIGIILYRLISGSLPYEHESDIDREEAIKKNKRNALSSDYSKDLRDIVDMLLVTDPT